MGHRGSPWMSSRRIGTAAESSVRPARVLREFGSTLAPLLCLGVSLIGCQSSKTLAGPTIEFTEIPPAAQGGRERVDTISGRVTGARPGQQIVVYARSGPWWVQPWPEKALIPINPDSTWSTPTHLGFEYAALLVGPGFQPAATLDVVPAAGGPIILVETTKGTGPPQDAPTKPLAFSGFDWVVRTISS